MDKKLHYHGHRNRLRQRLNNFGIESLQEYEIVELLLTYVLPRRDVKPIAKELLNNFCSIKGIMDASPEELTSIKFITENFTTLLKVIKGINIIYQKQNALQDNIFHSMDKLVKYCIDRLGWKKEEEFLIIFLDSGYRIISENNFPSKEFYFSGTIDRAVVYPRTILEEALKRKAYAMVICHNHPNGNLQPSKYDKNLTDVLSLATKTVGITLHDHIIVSSDNYFSFRKQGLL